MDFPYGHHNHDPAITFCPHNGDLFIVFYSTWKEEDRECGLASTTMKYESDVWTTPKSFYNTPYRLNTGPAFW